jgi:predicted amidohydrolase
MLRYSSLILVLSSAVSLQAVRADQVKPIQESFEPKAPANLEAYTKVAVIQFAPHGVAPISQDKAVIEAFKKSTREALEEEIRVAASNGAKLIITPEFGLVGYPDIPELEDEDDNFRNRDDVEEYVETIPGPTTRYFGKVAKELGVYIHIGMVEVDAKTKKYYNTAVALSPAGDVVASYRKMGLFEIEEDFLSAGEDGTTYEAPFGRVGLIICSDVYHSEPLASYRRAKVDVIALSTSWAQMNTGWGYFTRAARENNMYLLAANMPYFPDSGVINPDGSAQSHFRQTARAIGYGYLPNKKARR